MFNIIKSLKSNSVLHFILVPPFVIASVTLTNSVTQFIDSRVA